MLPGSFVYVGAAMYLIGLIPYLRDTLRGETAPHRVTWFLWGFIPLVTYVVQVHLHVGVQSFLTLVFGVSPILVLGASVLSKAGSWEITLFDWVCASLSLVGLAVYVVTARGVLSIVLLLVADFAAAIPTLRKSWTTPSSETWTAFAFGAGSSIITLLTVTNFDVATVLFPAYIAIQNTAAVAIITLELGPKFARRQASPD